MDLDLTYNPIAVKNFRNINLFIMGFGIVLMLKAYEERKERGGGGD